MLSLFDNISFSAACQAFVFSGMESLEGTVYRSRLVSKNATTEEVCPFCGSKVHVNAEARTTLTDAPLSSDFSHKIDVYYHRYQCQSCLQTYSESIPIKYPGTRITTRAANFIESLLSHGMSIKAVTELSGVHWNTVHRIHEDIMTTAIEQYENVKAVDHYKPTFLAVDEFAIHKGHTYATCVLDLNSGHVIWVGKGRSKSDFEHFFKDISPEYLEDVQAVAMDMNASYNILVSKYLPHAAIVYDRYHMQAQFGKDVLGVVRLTEARKHQKEAKELEAAIPANLEKDKLREYKGKIKEQKKLYTKIKKARWTILCREEKLEEEKKTALNSILREHKDLSVCYAMKEELCALFALRDIKQAEEAWVKWFDAAEESGIEPLVKFARQKRKRLAGLVSHAQFPISTGPLEGLNNKIKVAKRIAYGYRNDDYFFTLIRFSTLPSQRKV